MNFFVLFTFFAVASAIIAALFFWASSDSYGRDAEGAAFVGVISTLFTILWTGLALGAYFA